MPCKDSLLMGLGVSWQTALDRQCLLNLLLHCLLSLLTLIKAVGPILWGSRVLFRLLFVCKLDSRLQGYF